MHVSDKPERTEEYTECIYISLLKSTIMERPKIAKIIIQWIDKNGEEHSAVFNEQSLEDAETLIGLMTGNITEADLGS